MVLKGEVSKTKRACGRVEAENFGTGEGGSWTS